MFTIFFIGVLVISMFLVNKKNGQENTDDSMVFETKDSLVILGVFIATFILNYVFSNYFKNAYLISAVISILPFTLIMTVLNANRALRIRKRQDQIINIYEAAADILGNVEPEDIDFSDVPFEFKINEENKSIDTIIFDTSKIKIGDVDSVSTLATYGFNKYFPEFQWVSKENVVDRELSFHGLPVPPKIAMYPGSDYRPNSFIPFGVAGAGEVGWYITKDERGKGFSSFQYENGDYSENVDVPTTPQFMLGGSTGGGKFIWNLQKVVIKK